MKSSKYLDSNWILVLAMIALVSTSAIVVLNSLGEARNTAGEEQIKIFLRGKHATQEDTMLLKSSLSWHQIDSTIIQNKNNPHQLGLKVDFILIFSRKHCGNCVRDEAAQLNKINVAQSEAVGQVIGYSLDNPADSIAHQFNNTYANIAFPVQFASEVRDYFGDSLGQTPVLYVVRSSNVEILDVHRPIPTDTDNIIAFYEKWHRLLQI